MKSRLFFTSILILIFSITGFSQNAKQEQKATLIRQADFMVEVPSIAYQMANGTFKPAVDEKKEYNPKRRDANKAVPGKGFPKGDDPLWKKQSKSGKIKGKEPILTFQAASSGSTPTDPTGAVGPNHFVNAWNSSFRIWDKDGNPLTPAASLGTIFPGETAGDPIVMYDPFADRFVVTEFTFMNGFLVAVSQGPDPVNSGWYTYYFSTNSFPDYPKFSLWSDGYYITSNKNSWSAGSSEVVYAIERDKMLNGDTDAEMIGFPLPTISTNGFYSPLGFNVTGSEMPPPGNAPIVYMQDDSWSGVSTDHLKIWKINVDWDTPSNSTISNPEMTFWYHMYGTQMGLMELYFSVDGGSSWFFSGWSKSGNLGDNWQEAVINISTYSAEDDFMFKLKGTTGPGLRSDMAVDDFSIDEPGPVQYCESVYTDANFLYIQNVTLNTINNTIALVHKLSAIFVARLACSASHQFKGRICCARKVTTPARLILAIFAPSNTSAPPANRMSPAPSSNPPTTAGGNSATATITPITAVEMPEVKASAPALPEANASTILPKETYVRERIAVF